MRFWWPAEIKEVCALARGGGAGKACAVRQLKLKAARSKMKISAARIGSIENELSDI